MGIVRAAVCLTAITLAGCAGDERPAQPRAAADARTQLVRAARWLWNQQAADGSWRSETHGLLRSGQALTPWVLFALLSIPEEITPAPAGATDRALQYLREQIDVHGALGLADPTSPEYPNYATALALRCLVAGGRPEDAARIERLRTYLADQQYREENGFEPGHPAFGGWGFGGPLPPGSPGHMDLAHTRHVLEALRCAGHIETETRQRCEEFLRLVQRHPSCKWMQPCPGTVPGQHLAPFVAGFPQAPYDGGFYFSPVVWPANKGGMAGPDDARYFCSYASATCDGLLTLLAAGVLGDDERVARAVDWLRDHPRLDYSEGIPASTTEPWRESIFFYHLAARAEVYGALDWPDDWPAEVARLLAHRQRSDGRYVNEVGHLMKEDDPLIATALVVRTLSLAVSP